MFKVGDVVSTKSGIFWHGDDVGDRLGKIISTKGHIIIELYDYDDNPVKCFTYDIEPAFLRAVQEIEISLEDEIENLFKKMTLP